MVKIFYAFLVLLIVSVSVMAQSLTGLKPPSQNAVEATLQLFENYPIVAIGENHSLKELGEFYIDLIKHPDFATEVGNVVFEFGNSFYQPIIDQYLMSEDVPYEEVRKAWTTLIATGGPTEVSEMYGQFYKAVREVNQSLPDKQKIKIWLGDPPASPDDPSVYGENFPDRDAFYADVVMNEILAKDKKTLIIMGVFHFIDDVYTKSSATVAELEKAERYRYNVAAYINAYYPEKMYTIQVHWGLPNYSCNQELEAKFAKWSAPFLLPLQDTSLAKFLNDEQCKMDNDWSVSTKAWADSFLYLGPIGELTDSPLPNDKGRPYLELLFEWFPSLKEEWK
jgi:hypothetical protein